jgi:hypothetical protein
VVVGELDQWQAAVQAVGPELPVQGVGDLEQVAITQARPQPLVQFVIGHAVQPAGACEASIVSVDHLAEQGQRRVPAVAVGAQLRVESVVDPVGRVQPQTIDPPALHPAVDGRDQVFAHRRVLQVQAHQLVGVAPAVIGERVPQPAPPLEVHAREPAGMGGFPAARLQVPERGKTAPHVAEHGVEQDAEATVMRSVDKSRQCAVVPEASVHAAQIDRVIAMGRGLAHRSQQDRRRAQLPDVIKPGMHAREARDAGRDAVVVARRTTGSRGVDVIEDGVFEPGIHEMAFLVVYRPV